MDILIYGAGERCANLLKKLNSYSDVVLKGIADQYKMGERYGYELFDLMGEKQINIPKDMVIVVSLASIKSAYEVCRKLESLGYTNIYLYLNKTKTFNRDFLNNECLKISSNKDAVILPSLEMHVTDFCNLNCSGCTHFSPLYEKKYPEFDKRFQDLIEVRKLFDRVLVLSLLGGEPLLNPEINKYVKKARQYFTDTEIQIVTNGILIPKMSEEFFETVKESKCTIVVSEYAPTHKMIGSIVNTLEEHEIDYIIRKQDKKQKFNRPLSLSANSTHERMCISDGCTAVNDGRIARCPTLLYVEKFNEAFKQNLPLDGILKLSECHDGKDLLLKMKKSVPLCEHCIKDEIDWHICGKNVEISDFAVLD